MSDVNMLTSLKALLFSSAATAMPAGGAGAQAVPGEGAADFASLLDGTMDIAADAPAPALMAELAAPGEEGAAQAGTASPLPHGLATALNAIQTHGKASPPLPQGIARKVEEAMPAVSSVTAAIAPAETGTADPVEGAPAPAAEDAPETPVVEADAADEWPAAKPLDLARAPHLAGKAQARQVVFKPVTDAPLQTGEPAEQDSGIKDEDDAVQPSDDAVTVPALPLPAVMPPQPIALQDRTSVPIHQTMLVPSGVPQSAPTEPLAANMPMVELPAVKQAVDPATPQRAMPLPVESTETASTDTAVLPDQPLVTVPAAKPQSEKSEALALLQLVRDQLAARPSGTPARVGDQVPVAIRSKPERSAPVSDTAAGAPFRPAASDAMPQPMAQPSATPTVPAAPPVVDLSATLGAQMVDMGVSGQWIDNLARDIAGLSAHGAQGRFQINTDQLGPVQVDIRQGTDGAAVSLTVASEAAETALRQDSDRLRLDASLSAVRIAEVKIERAPHVAEAARTDSANQQSAQQQSSQTANGWANNGQNMAQSQGQAQGQAQSQGRWRAQENSTFAAKNSGDPAVLNHDEPRRAAHEAVRARYA